MHELDWEKIAARLRYLILSITHQVGSGHPTTCFSSIELMTVLFFKYLKYDPKHPQNCHNDRVIFSKGHASALLYSLYSVAGLITPDELMQYRHFSGVLEGHPTFRFKYTEAATGSLGQGLSAGAGMAWAMKQQGSNGRVYCLLGDGEMAEGAVWEALVFAAQQKLNHLVAIVDINGYGQSDKTMSGFDIDVFHRRFSAAGWATLMIDGHNFTEINTAFEKAMIFNAGPIAILAKTIKGKGISVWENQNGWHNKMLPKDELTKQLAYFQEIAGDVKGTISKPDDCHCEESSTKQSRWINGIAAPSERSRDDKANYSQPIATKQAFGNALVKLGRDDPRLIVLDADVSNSLHTDLFQKEFPDRFLQMYIAEQNMAGAAIGISKMGYLPVINTFASFLTRAHDQLRMMPLSDVTVLVHGSYVGASLGRDGPSQMGLEDLALMRSIFGSTVLYPSDPYQTEKLTQAMLGIKGVVYMRTTREPTPVIYRADDEFPVGGCRIWEIDGNLPAKMVRPINVKTLSNHVPVTIIAAGITLHESLKAQAQLVTDGMMVRVVDCYSIKPLDVNKLKNVAKTSQALLVVEDHYPEGGLTEAVRSALYDQQIPIYQIAVSKLPQSGSAMELLGDNGLDSQSISRFVKTIMKK